MKENSIIKKRSRLIPGYIVVSLWCIFTFVVIG